MSEVITTEKPIQLFEETLSSQERALPDEGQQQYVNSWPAFFDKYIQQIKSGEIIPFGLVLVAIGLIFVKNSESINSLGDLLRTAMKCLPLMVLYLIYCTYRGVLWLVKNRHKDTTKKLNKDAGDRSIS
ncbi:MAG: hypothetical protein GY845_28345 [Planctomycetes bacterium]|nr:hypothetical protein [Planctomycetota bacterium]